VLNIWIGPTEAPERAEIVTDDRKRGIRIYGWTYAHHLFYLQDTDGNENFHVFVVDPLDQVTRDLTLFDGIRAGIAAISRIRREHVLVHLNRRGPRYFDLHSLHVASGELALVEVQARPSLQYDLAFAAYRLVQPATAPGRLPGIHSRLSGL
jgi:hypothetical protein